MDLNTILEKTKTKSDRIKRTREPVHIATTERPYEITTVSNPKNEQDIPKGLYNSINIEQKTANNSETNRKQSVNKLETNRKQTVNKSNTEKKNRKQTVNTTVNTSVNKLETNRKQTVNNSPIKTPFSSLVGLQRAALIFVYEICKANRGHTTDPLTLEHIASHVKTSTKATKTTIQRLVKNGCLTRCESKSGRGGWSRYSLPETIFQELLQAETVNKLETNRKQTVTTTVNTTVNSSSSSSSNNINKTTTTGETWEFKNLPEEWESIDIDSLSSIGFTTTHLAQIARQGKLTAEIVKNSIEAFAFDLKFNEKAKTLKGSPLNYFMGVVRNGQPYAPPGNYESPQDREMRIYLERKREIEKVRAEREEELIKLAFNEWEREQTDDYKQSLLPESVRVSKLSVAKHATLRTYFTKEVWPEKRKELEKKITDVNWKE